MKVQNFRTSKTFNVIILLSKQKEVFQNKFPEICSNGADGMANSVGPDLCLHCLQKPPSQKTKFLTYVKLVLIRRDVPVGVPLDLSTPTGMSCIGTYGENCKSDNVSKYRVLLVAVLLLWHEN